MPNPKKIHKDFCGMTFTKEHIEIPVNLIYEDSLSRVVLYKLLNMTGNWQVGISHNAGGKSRIESRIKGYNNAAKGMAYLILVDLNGECQCAPELVNKWVGNYKNHNLLL